MKENKIVLETLLRNGEITRQNIVERIEAAQQSGNSVLDLLIRDRVVSAEKLLLIFHNEWGFDVYHPQEERLDTAVLAFFTREQAQDYLVFPLKQPDQEHLMILMADPTDEDVIRS